MVSIRDSATFVITLFLAVALSNLARVDPVLLLSKAHVPPVTCLPPSTSIAPLAVAAATLWVLLDSDNNTALALLWGRHRNEALFFPKYEAEVVFQ